MTFSKRFFVIPIVVGIVLLFANIFSCSFVDTSRVCIPNQFVNGRDTFVYLRYLRDAEHGVVAFFDQSTNEPQRIGITNVFWASIGSFGRLFHLTPLALMSLLRVFSPLALLLTLFWSSSFIAGDRDERKLLVLLSAAMGGTHILFSVLPFANAAMPSLIISSFLYPFPAALAPANTTIATILCAITLLLFFRWSETRHLVDLLLASVIGLILLQFQPYLFPIMFFVPACWMTFRRTRHTPSDWISFILILLAWCVPIGYLTLIVLSDPFTTLRFSANVTPSGPFLINLLVLGIPGWFAYRGYRSLAPQPVRAYLALWICSSFLFAHLPFFPTQDRFFEGVGIPFSLLIALGILRSWQSLRSHRIERTSLFLAFILIVFYIPSIAYALLNLRFSTFTLPEDISAISRQLSLAPSGTVLATELESYYLLGETSDILYVAHGHETIQFAEKSAFRDLVIDGSLSGSRLLDELHARHVDFVVLPSTSKTDRAMLDLLLKTDHYELYRIPPMPTAF